MFLSFLIKLAMLVVTMGVVCWIGWTVPQARYADAGREMATLAGEDRSIQSGGPPAVDAAVLTQGPSARQHPAPGPSRRISERLDLNRATEQELEALPGIGPVLAERIVEYRQSRGVFRDVEQLRNVKGIGKKKFERLRALVNVAPVTGPARGGRKTT